LNLSFASVVSKKLEEFKDNRKQIKEIEFVFKSIEELRKDYQIVTEQKIE